VGSLDDRVELAAELALPPTAPAHAVVAAGYRRWGTGVLPRLRGAYALLLWNVKEHSGLLATDRLGARTVVWSEDAGRIAFATDVRDLLDLLPATPAPSDGAVVSWLVDGTLPRESTLYRGVRRLPGGRALRFGNPDVEEFEFWRPHFVPPSPQGRAEAVGDVGSTLARAVERACARGAPTGVLLSGGLDSTAVAAFAAAAGGPLTAYSAVFPDHPVTDESEHIAANARALGLSSRRLAFHSGGAFAPTLRHLERWKLPPATPNLFFHEPLLRLAREDGVAALLDGEGGDELFGPSPYLLADHLRAGRLGAARAAAVVLAGPDGAGAALTRFGVRGALPASVHLLARRLRPRPPWWLTPEGAALYKGSPGWAWKKADGPRWWAHLADTLTAGRERAGAHDALRHRLEGVGLVGGHPLLEDSDLIATTLALPPRLAYDGTVDRPLLREAVAAVVPAALGLRTEKRFFNVVLADAVHRADEEARTRLLGGLPEIARFVRPALAATLQATPARRQGGRDTFLLWRLTALESWLRVQAEPSFARRALEELPLPRARFEPL
jgi:asparagine synthase (glutamine-hydrolysing)